MAATVAAPLERRLGEIPGVTEITSSSSLGSTNITIQFDLEPQHRRRGARRAGGAQRRADRSAGRPADAAEHPQGQSVRGADPDPGADLEDACCRARCTTSPTRVIAQRIAQVDGVAEVTRQRRRAAGDPHSRQSGGDRLDGRQHGGRAHRDRQRQCDGAARHLRRARSRAHHRHQRPAARRARLREHRGEDRPTAPWCGSAASPRSSRACATAARRPGSTRSRRSCWSSPSRPTPTSSRRSTASASCCRSSSAGFRPTSTFRSCPTAPRPSAPACSTCSSRWSPPSRW